MPNIQFVRFLTEDTLTFEEPQRTKILQTVEVPGDVVGLAEDYDWESPLSKLPRDVQEQMHWRPLTIEQAIYHVDEHPEGSWTCAQAFFKFEGIEGFHPSSEFCDVRKVFERAGLLLTLDGEARFVPIDSEVFPAFLNVDRAFEYAEPFVVNQVERRAMTALSDSFRIGEVTGTDQSLFLKQAADEPRWIIGRFVHSEDADISLVSVELVEASVPDFQVQNAMDAVRTEGAIPRV